MRKIIHHFLHIKYFIYDINPFIAKRKETFRAKSVLKKKVFKIA